MRVDSRAFVVENSNWSQRALAIGFEPAKLEGADTELNHEWTQMDAK